MATWVERLNEIGPEAAVWSVFQNDPVSGDKWLLDFVDRWFPGRTDLKILEVGTCRGVSACILAERGEVHTFDIKVYPETEAVIRHFGMEERVTRYVGPPEEMRALIEGQMFDMAFVDGMHEYESVTNDWYFAMGHTRRILLHDYVDYHPGCVRAINELMELIPCTNWETGGTFAAATITTP